MSITDSTITPHTSGIYWAFQFQYDWNDKLVAGMGGTGLVVFRLIAAASVTAATTIVFNILIIIGAVR